MESAGRPRRATADPGVYSLPGASLPAGFAAEARGEGEGEPAATRPAATVVLLRDAPRGLEALLLRRHGRSGFAAGAWVFPGGTVDEADRAAGVELLGREDAARWAARLEVDDPEAAAGYLFAALREAFEETAILVAPGGSRGDTDAMRNALLQGELSFAQVLRRLGATAPPRQLAYIARWITPRPEPRRYDTRFFMACVPADAEARPHRAELVEERWVSPAAALAGFTDGTLPMLPPTVHTLRRLEGFSDAASALAALGSAPVAPILPEMRPADGGVEIVLPPAALAELRHA